MFADYDDGRVPLSMPAPDSPSPAAPAAGVVVDCVDPGPRRAYPLDRIRNITMMNLARIGGAGGGLARLGGGQIRYDRSVDLGRS